MERVKVTEMNDIPDPVPAAKPDDIKTTADAEVRRLNPKSGINRIPKKKFRKVAIKEAEDGQHYYVALDKKGEPLYTSETFTRKSDAVTAARREHEGRNEKFDYVLEYTNAKGSMVRETL